MTGSETIAAVSTAPGEGGIGIVRISGEKAAEILGKIFVSPPRSGERISIDGAHNYKNVCVVQPVRSKERSGGIVFADRTMYYGHIVEPSTAEMVDEALVCFMKGPRSYTGEDVCEIQCHGGSVPLRRILSIVCELGAMPAQPGEFTKRAFLNGRLDLLQAGAVIDLIRSRTARGYHAAREQAEGRLSERVHVVREILLGALAEIAVRIDYPEAFEREDAGIAGLVEGALAMAAGGIDTLLSGAEAGRIVKDGMRVVIIGKPNTGKSSLFNAMAREDAAIVTETAGTTRDALEIWLDIRGVPVLLVDTAGIREDVGQIEAIGIARAKEQYQRADVSILLLDGSQAISVEDIEIARGLDPDKKLIVIVNKADLPQAFGKEEVVGILPFDFDVNSVILLSLIGDETCGVTTIESMLESFALGGAVSGASLLVTKERHKTLLASAAAELAEARSALAEGAAPEFVEINIRAVWESLGEMIGETASDEVIDRVFEEFCVGK